MVQLDTWALTAGMVCTMVQLDTWALTAGMVCVTVYVKADTKMSSVCAKKYKERK
jgi:hypothetical protein